MSTIIKIKNSGVSGSPSALATGELAYSYLAGTLSNGGERLYIGTGAESLAGEAANLEVIGGTYFTSKLDHTLGTLTASSALIVDANSKIDIFNVDNLRLDGNTISTTDANGDLTIDPNGTGAINLSATTNITGTLNLTGGLSQTGNLDVTGNTTVSGTFDVNGQSTLASLNVEDLTNNRITIAGVNGELEDDANFTFDGTTFNLGLGNFTVAQATGNTQVKGTLNVDGQSTLASLNVEDLTSTRVVYVGADGELVDSADMAFTGSGATSQLQLVGKLNVDAQTTLASVNVEDLTATRIVYTGALGELVDSADMTFSGAGATSQLQLAGKLNVDAEATLASVKIENLTSGRLPIIGAGGVLIDNAALTFNGFNQLGVYQLVASGTIEAQGVLDKTLTAGRVTFAGTEGRLTDNSTLTFNTATSNLVLTGDLDITGSLDVDNINVNGNTISSTNSNGNIVIAPNALGITSIDSATAVKIPVGNTASRPGTPGAGMIRFNTTDTRYEAYDGNNWTGLGGVIDVDQNTFIRAETAPGTNNNDLEFYTDGVKRVNLDENGMVFTDTAIPLQVGKIKILDDTISSTSGGVIYIDPNPSGSAGSVVIEGNLTVNGTQTIINSTTVSIDDPVFNLGGDTVPTVNDGLDKGIAFQWYDTSAHVGFFGWDLSDERFKFIPEATESSGTYSGILGDVAFGNTLINSLTFSAGNYTSTSILATDGSGNVSFVNEDASSVFGVNGQVLQMNASGVPSFGHIDCGTY